MSHKIIIRTFTLKLLGFAMTVQDKVTPAILTSHFNTMRSFYHAKPFSDCEERKAILKTLKTCLIKHEQAIYEALKKDYGYRSEFDSLVADILPSVSAIRYAIKNLKKWMKPSKRHAGLILAPSSVSVLYQPLGVVGVVTPWNFPIFLALGPAIQALAAGNRIMIKMSEFTPHVNQVLRQVVEPISDYICIIEGDADIGAAFSALPFDHLIFTGSTSVGKRVARSASDNLTPMTLELGGKSPTIIDSDIDIHMAVDAIIFGKSVNSGQICVSPDYIFLPKLREKEFVTTFIERYREYFIHDNNSNAHTHIVTDRQHDRLLELLEDAKNKGATVHAVKAIDLSEGRCLWPQLVTDVSQDMAIIKDEIFGSIVPIMTYDRIDEVIEYINIRPRPLALYIMSKNNELIEKLLKNTHSGGVAINDSAMHVAADDAPFGGVGDSGMGHYHAHEGFLTFSKAKTVLYSSSWIPKNRFILKNRDFMFKVMRKFFLR